MLLQGLVSKPEYNGKRACVLSFDDLAGRYTVALDEDGKELRLKAESMVLDGTDKPPLPDVQSQTRLKAANEQAMSLAGAGKHAQAERILREAVAAERPVLGAEHINILAVETSLAQFLTEQTRCDGDTAVQRGEADGSTIAARRCKPRA